jgi:nitroreductase/NAD-dependent dihydropyrimidine dehydrogenase PreA subunit
MAKQKISIDIGKCSGCGLCARVCPHRLFRVDAGEAFVISGDCMGCDQCRAVCPSGAIDTDGLITNLGFQNISETLESIMPGKYDCDALVQLMRSRRSCRNYTDRSVPLDVLEDLVKIGTTAPSGTNSQSWNFVILPERKDVEVLGNLTADFYRQLNCQAKNPVYRFFARFVAGDALSKYYRNYYDSVREALREWDEEHKDRLFHGASAAILITGKKTASCPAEDALLASQNILLAAHALGLGSCLIGFVVEAMRRSLSTRKLMAIPADEEIYSVIGLGYPAIQYPRVAGRRAVQPRVLHLGAAGS